MAAATAAGRRGRRLGLLVGCVMTLALASPVRAEIGPTHVVVGPDPSIGEVGGVAMAPDGTGGVVFSRRLAGVPHIFVARYFDGRWADPVRVDVNQEFESQWPRIVAGNGGILRVVWTQEAGVGTDRLYSASAGPGPSGFAPPQLVDRNIGEMNATWPSMATNAGGQTYLAYRVLTRSTVGNLPPGYVSGEVRIARFKGPRWENLGVIARNPQQVVREPSAANAPRVAVDVPGNAIVAWQEPDDKLVDRIWARRVFASGIGVPLLASPATAAGAPVDDPADGFALAAAGFGEGTVLSRVTGRDGASRIYANSLPAGFSDVALTFSGAQALTLPGTVAGLPAVASTQGGFIGAVGVGDAVLRYAGTDATVGPPDRLDDGSADPGTPADPVAAAGLRGASVVVWRFRVGGASGVAVAEHTFAGAEHRGVLASGVSGPVDDLRVAGSGLGDALVAFRQGPVDDGAVAVAAVDGPPQPFLALAPRGWVPPERATISWEAARDAMGSPRYAVLLDGHALPAQASTSVLPYGGALGDGRYEVRVRATDSAGQVTLSEPVRLSIDGTPPEARLKLRGRRLLVRVSDAPGGSGIAGAPTVWLGGGPRQALRGPATFRVRRAGALPVVVRARDRAGNALVFRRTVRVR